MRRDVGRWHLVAELEAVWEGVGFQFCPCVAGCPRGLVLTLVLLWLVVRLEVLAHRQPCLCAREIRLDN